MKTKTFTVEGQVVFISTEPEFPKEAEQILKQQLAGMNTFAQVTTIENGRIKLPKHVAESLFDVDTMKVFHFHLKTAFNTYEKKVNDQRAEDSAFQSRLQNADQEAEKHPL